MEGKIKCLQRRGSASPWRPNEPSPGRPDLEDRVGLTAALLSPKTLLPFVRLITNKAILRAIKDREMTFLRRFLILAVLISIVVSACSRGGGIHSTPTSPPPPASPVSAADQFLKAWQEQRYEDMYSLLASSSQQEISREQFVQRYQAIAAEATIKSVSYQISTPNNQAQDKAEVPVVITINTTFFGDIRQENTIPAMKEGDWRIVWSPTLIFKQLIGDTLVRLQQLAPLRGSILDRNGKALAVDGPVYDVGVVPGKIQDKEALIATLAKALGMDQATVRARVSVQAQPDWFVPVKVLPFNTPATTIESLKTIPGVMLRQESSRVYPYGSVASHVIGYLTNVTADELKSLAAQGYDEDDLIGRAGLEQSMNDILAGQNGARLVAMHPNGVVEDVIAEKPAKPASDVHLTIDIALQQKAEELLGGRPGVIIAIDPRTNAILAMVSQPGFDPNAFVQGLSAADWQKLSSDPNLPLLDRATQGAYPPGSVFKAVTAAAGMEKGGYTPNSTFACTPTWTGLGPDNVKKNWRTDDRGTLDLLTGLAESCNPVFYEIGKKLDQTDPNILPDFAKAMGLGKPTDIEGLPEASGLVPSPDWKKSTRNQPWYTGDAVNMAIGQGDLLVTPLQIANMYSAIASGNLRTPTIIDKVTQGDKEVRSVTAAKLGDLPMSAATLNAIRQGMYKVINDPRGTGLPVFQGAKYIAAGKSGTAEDAGTNSHAWFLAFAPFEQPQILALAFLDEGGWGSEHAGPIVRQLLDYYFSTTPGR